MLKISNSLKISKMLKLTIRVKLLILSGSLLGLMIVSSLYMRSQIVAGSDALQGSVQTLESGSAALRANSKTLQAGSLALQSNNETLKAGNATLHADQILSSRLKLASQAQKAFADVKYWLTDLAVSWQNESEENAEAARERLAGILEEITKFAPGQVESIGALVEIINEKSMAAVDAYTDEKRVLGNSLLAEARESMTAVDTSLTKLVDDLRLQAEKAKKGALANAEAALAPAAQAVNDAQAALEPAQQAVAMADEAVVSARSYFAQASQASQITIILILGAVALAMVLTFLIVRSITKPIAGLTGIMVRLAEGDHAVEVPGTERKDEIGEMAGAVQVFKDNAIAVTRMKEEQEQQRLDNEKRVREDRVQLADHFEQAVMGIVQSVGDSANAMSSSAEQMRSVAAQTSERSATVTTASTQASENVQSVAAATEEMSATVQEISRQVSTSTEISNNAVAESQSATDQVRGLAEASQRIGEVVGLINDIANQTNLLALNATIEAARAGDAGKGFAVVASEVKNLASQTAKATEDISGQITEIQNATGSAVTAIEGISSTIGQLSEIGNSIAAAVEEQGASTEEISRNVQEAAKGTKEVNHNIVEVDSGAQETGTSAGEVLDATKDLSKQATNLREEVEKFLASVRAA